MSKSKAANSSEPVVIKKYANRRLYNTETSSYITLDLLSQMTREGREFVVVDAKTGEDITHNVLTQRSGHAGGDARRAADAGQYVGRREG